ncbi:MAG TPA: PEP-CTERM sorting domain-containing protein [Nitrospirota bacterium]
MKKIIVIGALVALSIIAIGVPAGAVILADPATLHIGTGAGTPNALGSIQIDPVFVSTTNFSITQNSGGAIALNDPLVVLLAVPNTGTLTGNIASATLYNPYSLYPSGGTALSVAAGVNPSLGFGNLTNTTGAFQTKMTSGDLYGALGLGPIANNSFNWSNLTGATLPNGSPNPDAGVTAFNLYAYSLSNSGTNLDGKGLVNVLWSAGGLPGGTFIAAFGVSTNKKEDLVPYSTPFTEAGLVGTPPPPPPSVPEPSTLLLLGSGLLGLGLFGRKRFRK